MVIDYEIHMSSHLKVFGKSIPSKVFGLLLLNYVDQFIIPAFESFAKGCPLSIPVEIEAKYVQFAEEIISISYTQSEKFSSVGIIFITVMY